MGSSAYFGFTPHIFVPCISLAFIFLVIGFNVCYAWIGVKYGLEYSSITFALILLVAVSLFAGYVYSQGGLHRMTS